MQTKRAQEANEQAVQETSSMLQERFLMLDEKQLDEVVGAGWPLGLPGVRRVLGLPRSNSAPGQLESAPFYDSRPGIPSSNYSNSNLTYGSLKAFKKGDDAVGPVSRTPSPH